MVEKCFFSPITKATERMTHLKRGAAYPMRMKGDEEWNRTLRVE